MYILPTHKRRANLIRFFEACRDTHVTEPLLLLIDEDDKTYDGMELPMFVVGVKTCSSGMSSTERLNEAFRSFPAKDYYGVLGDDVVPESMGWDRILAEECGRDGKHIVYPDDGLQQSKLCTIPVISGEFCRAWGKLAEQSIKHWFSDNVWMMLGYYTGTLKYIPEVRLTHCHWVNGKAHKDGTYMKQPSPEIDLGNYEKYMNWQFTGDVAKIKHDLGIGGTQIIVNNL